VTITRATWLSLSVVSVPLSPGVPELEMQTFFYFCLLSLCFFSMLFSCPLPRS
jgi:hypothetical protein